MQHQTYAMASQSELASPKGTLMAVQGDRTACEAVCRQHWPKEGAIQTTARRESALACSIVVLRALAATLHPFLRGSISKGEHPLFNAAYILDAEKSMRSTAAATQPANQHHDFFAIMERPAFLTASFWSMTHYGQLFHINKQSYLGIDNAEVERCENARRGLAGIYASKGMLVIKPSDGNNNNNNNPETLHEAVQQAYKTVIAAAPPEVSSGYLAAPEFIRLYYDGRMGFEKLCFTLDNAVEGNAHAHTPPQTMYYQCIAAVCLTSELHTVTLWDEKGQIQDGPPFQSPWWVGERNGTSPVGDGTYMLYFKRHGENIPCVVNRPATTITEHLVPVTDDHNPANITGNAQLRSQIEGEFQGRIAEAVQTALSTAQEAYRNEVQGLQDKLRKQAAKRKHDVDSLTKERDDLARQLSDANTEIVAQRSKVKKLQQQLDIKQLPHDGTVDVSSKKYSDKMQSLVKSIEDDLQSQYKAKEEELEKRFGERVREGSSVQQTQAATGKRSADDAEFDESKRNSRPRKRTRITEPVSFADLVERTFKQFRTLPNNIECLKDARGNRPSFGEIFHCLSYMAEWPRGVSYLDTFFVEGIANQWHCLDDILRDGDKAALLKGTTCPSCDSQCVLIRLLETEDKDAVEAIQFTFSNLKPV